MLEKTFQPAEIEPRIAIPNGRRRKPSRRGAARAAAGQRTRPYSIVIPPPNVTGSLHMGHALNNTLQDVLVRFERMRGRDVLWQPGTDHAGIATQMVVERKLAADGEPGRRDLGREKFLEKVWTWKAESGGTIVNQLKRLGASCDWSRERFTMDEGLSKAVVKVFVELYSAGLIYKDKRLVNWDPKFQTAISDLEVVQVEKRGSFSWASGDPEKPFDEAALAKVLAKDPNGHMYHFRYPLTKKVAGYDKDYIVVATTRPETMLGDTGVAVHPEDERYAAAGQSGREGEAAAGWPRDSDRRGRILRSREGHGRGEDHARARLQRLRSRQAAGAGQDQHPRCVRHASTRKRREAYRGLDRFEARIKVVAAINALGLLEKIEPSTQHGAAWRPLGRGHRAVADGPVVRERGRTGEARARRREGRQDALRAGALRQRLLPLAGEHPALVHLAPAVVGPSDPGVVRAGRQDCSSRTMKPKRSRSQGALCQVSLWEAVRMGDRINIGSASSLAHKGEAKR